MTERHNVEGREGKRTACAYVRSSSAEQVGREAAVAGQMTAIVVWCAENDVVLVDVYSDPGASGSDHSRPSSSG